MLDEPALTREDIDPPQLPQSLKACPKTELVWVGGCVWCVWVVVGGHLQPPLLRRQVAQIGLG